MPDPSSSTSNGSKRVCRVPVPSGDFSIYGEVQNLFDREPPATPVAFGRTGAEPGNPNPQLYDILGRRYQIGLRYRF